MKITLFKNMKGLIHGGDPKRIGCDKDGVLKIGSAEISISSESDSIMPLLFHGATGDYKATFTDNYGAVYELEKVSVRSGRVAPPPPTTVELMDLRSRAEKAEEEIATIKARLRELGMIFDTDSLNFLIK